MMISLLENIIANGNRPSDTSKWGCCRVFCRDGFTFTVIAGSGCYSTPRDNDGPFTAVEVAYPVARPEPWNVWGEYLESPVEDGSENVFAYVPVPVLMALVELHGGELLDPSEYWVND